MVTHQMEEVERLCDRVILLKDGRSHAYGTVEQVQERFGGTTYAVIHTGVIPASAHYTVVSDVEIGSGRRVAELAPAPEAGEATVLAELVGAGVPVTGFTTQRTSLEEIFLRVYGTDSLHDQTGTEMAGVGA
ncbi:ATP-binding protein DrrA1-3 family domain-containing protein [Kocuria dechangensis]